MFDILQTIISFVFVLGVLITFHEFGHYWVAKKCGVKILRFSIGFGRPLYKRLFGPDNSEFIIAALPLGGYVKMLDEREGPVDESDRGRAFNHKPMHQRTAVVLAGPVFNFVFAVFAYWLMFVVGVPGLQPVIGALENDSLAMQSGLQEGDEIISVDSQRTPTWSSVIDVFVASVIEGKQVPVTVRGERGSERYIYIDLDNISVDEMAGGKLLDNLGITPKYPDMKIVIEDVEANSAAERSGLQIKDQLISVDDIKITNASEWVSYVQAHPGKTINVKVLRDEETLDLQIVPAAVVNDNEETIGWVGAWFSEQRIDPSQLRSVQSYHPGEAVLKSLVKTYDMSVMTLRILGKMIVGEASVKNLSGPISIAQYAGQSAGLGLAIFLGFLAIVSVSLGVLNLLPIPLLDGGHLLYYLIELIKGSPVSEATQMIGQQVGLVVLLSLMGIAFYNDIIRLVG